MKDSKKLIISIIAVIIIIIIVAGGTYSYWVWVSADADRTNISFSVNQTTIEGTLNANINGNANVSSTDATLKPATCTSANAIKKTVTIKHFNSTVQNATVTANLNVTAYTLRDAAYRPTSEQLNSLKYVLTTSSSNCTTGVVKTGDFSALTFASGNKNATNLPVTLFSQTFASPAEMSTPATQTYYLWVWLDSAYTHINTGTTNSDPMQGFSFTATWSGQIAQNNS